MTCFTARILSKDSQVIIENIDVWINFFRHGNKAVWDGSVEVPVTTPLTHHTYRLQLSDGREGTITNLTPVLFDENMLVMPPHVMPPHVGPSSPNNAALRPRSRLARCTLAACTAPRHRILR